MSTPYPRRRPGDRLLAEPRAAEPHEPVFAVSPVVRELPNEQVAFHASIWGGPNGWCPVPAVRAWWFAHELARLAEAAVHDRLLAELLAEVGQPGEPGGGAPARAVAQPGAPASRPGRRVESRR